MTRNRAQLTNLGGRIRKVLHDLYGEHGIGVLAKELRVPDHAWADYERGGPMPERIFLRFIDATGADPHWLLRGRGESYVKGRTEVPIRQNVRHLG